MKPSDIEQYVEAFQLDDFPLSILDAVASRCKQIRDERMKDITQEAIDAKKAYAARRALFKVV